MTEQGGMVLTKTLIECDKPDRNGRLYSRTLWEKEIQRLKKTVNNRELFVEACRGDGITVDLSRAAGIITDLSIDDDCVKAEIEILLTHEGQAIIKLIENNLDVEIFPSGMGCVDKDGVVSDYVLTSVHIREGE